MAFVTVDVTTVGEAVVTVTVDVIVATTLELALTGVLKVRTGSGLTGMFLLAGEALSLAGMELEHT